MTRTHTDIHPMHILCDKEISKLKFMTFEKLQRQNIENGEKRMCKESGSGGGGDGEKSTPTLNNNAFKFIA